MSAEQTGKHLIFPQVTDPAVRSEAAGHFGVNVGVGGELGALYAAGANKPVWAAILATGGALHFLLAKMNFSESRRIRGKNGGRNTSYDPPKASGVWVTSEALPLDEGNRPPAPSSVPPHIASRGAALAGRLKPPSHGQKNHEKGKS